MSIVPAISEVAAHADPQLGAVAARTEVKGASTAQAEAEGGPTARTAAEGESIAWTEADGVATAGIGALLIAAVPILMSVLTVVADGCSRIAVSVVTVAQASMAVATASAETTVAARDGEITAVARGETVQTASAGSDAAVAAVTMAQIMGAPLPGCREIAVGADHGATASVIATSTMGKTMTPTATVVAAHGTLLHALRKAVAAAVQARSSCGRRQVLYSTAARLLPF
jgi:hypothetical protein